MGTITSPAGYRYSPITGAREFHDGVDVSLPVGTPIHSPKDGVVTAVGNSASFGRFLRLEHANGYETFFAHLDDTTVAIGDNVYQGKHVAYSGNTGWSTAPHLHFSIFNNQEFIDPLTYFTFAYAYD